MNFSKIYKDSSEGELAYYRVAPCEEGFVREWIRGHFSYKKSRLKIIEEGRNDIETDWQAEDWEAFKLYLAL